MSVLDIAIRGTRSYEAVLDMALGGLFSLGWASHTEPRESDAFLEWHLALSLFCLIVPCGELEVENVTYSSQLVNIAGMFLSLLALLIRVCENRNA